MRRHAYVIVPISLAFAQVGFALPPGAAQRGFRDGANHHLGDDSFVERTGRAPGAADAEHDRMQTHLQYVRAQLAGRPATRPELEARRAQLLGYLDDYIAREITPLNQALPWRSPVFIDDDDRICAVGYLIERSVGRGLAERIAREHRYDFLEDIAAAMPEVRTWIDGSGLTLDELASIQPGYNQPQVEDWVRWDVAKLPPPDGAYRDRVTTGAWRNRRMEGAWTRTAGGTVVGLGALHHGDGTWTSFYRDGSMMATGPMVRNDPHGAWKLFHPSGNLAAEGRFYRGLRDGAWRFYYDTKARTPIATGAFASGSLVGAWQHYDADGKLLARSRTRSKGAGFGQYLLSVVPGPDGVVHEADLIGGPDRDRLDGYSGGGERVFVYQRNGSDEIFDADGNQLTRQGSQWLASRCPWSTRQQRVAGLGDVSTLHALLSREHYHSGDACGAPAAVPAQRGERIDHLLVQARAVRAVPPAFVKRLALGEDLDEAAIAEAVSDGPEDTDGDDSDSTYLREQREQLADLPRLLAGHMVWYIEWPHIDRRFILLFRTVPGYWPGVPNGDRRDEAERATLEGVAPTTDDDDQCAAQTLR
jgi:hypothetical protein